MTVFRCKIAQQQQQAAGEVRRLCLANANAKKNNS
jgi:hypothetical protein